MKPKYPGVYRGTVYSNRDPANQGRLRIQIPQLLATAPTEWAWPIHREVIQEKLPEVGQGIWVMFEGGDLDFPVWLGVFGNPLTVGSKIFAKSLPSGSYPTTIVVSTGAGGNLQLQLVDTLIALAQAVETLDGRVDSLETQVSSLETRVSNLESA